MKKYVEMLATDKDAHAAAVRIAKLIGDKSKKEYVPGQYVITKDGVVKKVTTITGTLSRTEQSYKDDTDINRLLEPAIKRGLLRHVTQFVGEYDDVPASSFQDAMFVVAKGNSMFEALPSAIRNKFEGKPEKFMAFVQDPANEGWLREQGLVPALDGLDRHGKPTGYVPTEKDVQEAPAEPKPADPAP